MDCFGILLLKGENVRNYGRFSSLRSTEQLCFKQLRHMDQCIYKEFGSGFSTDGLLERQASQKEKTIFWPAKLS